LDDEQIGNAVLLSYIEEAKSKVWINAKTGIAMELAIKENEKKADLPVKKLIPEDLHNFLDVFDDNKANRFPESDVWDHCYDPVFCGHNRSKAVFFHFAFHQFHSTFQLLFHHLFHTSFCLLLNP
jgi:hypothetical protein